jgi:hypothetical protein
MTVLVPIKKEKGNERKQIVRKKSSLGLKS